MEVIGTAALSTFLSTGWRDTLVTNDDIRRDSGYSVKSFSDLVSCVAKLAFYNQDHVLLYRGQNQDFKNGATQRSVLKPTIFRAIYGDPLPTGLPKRFARLALAEKHLVQEWGSIGLEELSRIERHRILRWSILQHYEVCATPLLDVTNSLRVAASIASFGRARRQAFVYVLGVPQLSGAITASAEADLQIVRLSSICPPSAKRPHFQDGYLVTEYPEIQTYDDRQHYKITEIDFGRRLLAKFRLEFQGAFWADPFPRLRKAALFPKETEGDKLAMVVESIKAKLGDDLSELTDPNL